MSALPQLDYTKLEALDISYNAFESVRFLSGMTSLRKLDISGNSISDISAMSSLN